MHVERYGGRDSVGYGTERAIKQPNSYTINPVLRP